MWKGSASCAGDSQREHLRSFSMYAVGPIGGKSYLCSKMINAFKGLLRYSDRMFNEVEYWLFWNMLQDVLNIAGPIRPATLWGQPWFLLSACAATQEATVCWGNDGQCNISLQFIPVWLWKCKLFEVSKHGKGSKMWGPGGPGSVSKSFLAAWHLRRNEVRWSIRTLALCEITPLYQSWSIQLATAQSCGLTILSSWMTISR